MPQGAISGTWDREISRVTADSRAVRKGSMFVAVRGEVVDGHGFIDKAIRAGACVIVAERAPSEGQLSEDVTWIHVGDSRAFLAEAAAWFYGNPSREMAVVGVTGTNGKTTTAYLVHQLMKKLWYRAGLMGTVVVDDGEEQREATSTTPDALEMQQLLSKMRDHACRGVAMEVSSHGIDQKRTAAVAFDALIFTNLTQDHLDYHGTMSAYFAAKKEGFEQLILNSRGKKPVAVVNLDDSHGAELVQSLRGRMPVATFGFGVHADFRAGKVRLLARGMEFELTYKAKSYLVRAPLMGRFNVSNLLGALAAMVQTGANLRDLIPLLSELQQVPGRMEYVGTAQGVTVFVDYAHTPDALLNACATVRELEPKRLITVFGCGGDRDRSKRPLMGAAASKMSDFCVITSDNPRSESPEAIVKEIESGMQGRAYRVILDRAEAIANAILAAEAGDVILIAGKGHEAYQQIGDQKLPFDDRKHASKALRDREIKAAEEQPLPKKY